MSFLRRFVQGQTLTEFFDGREASLLIKKGSIFEKFNTTGDYQDTVELKGIIPAGVEALYLKIFTKVETPTSDRLLTGGIRIRPYNGPGTHYVEHKFKMDYVDVEEGNAISYAWCPVGFRDDGSPALELWAKFGTAIVSFHIDCNGWLRKIFTRIP